MDQPPNYPQSPYNDPYTTPTPPPPPMGGDLPTFPMQSMPSQPPRKRRRIRWWGWTLIILGVLIALFVILGSAGEAMGPPPGTTSNPTPTPQATSAPIQASKPTVAATIPPTPTPRPVITSTPTQPGPAILGATLSDFEAKYGKLNDHSNPAQGEYYFSVYGNDKDDLTLQFTYNKYASAILFGSPGDTYWNETQAKDACLSFLPPDATYQRQMTIYDPSGNPQDEQMVYVSPSIGKLFPASAFDDENGNQTTPGTIGFILNHWSATQYIGCVVQVGLESK